MKKLCDMTGREIRNLCGLNEDQDIKLMTPYGQTRVDDVNPLRERYSLLRRREKLISTYTLSNEPSKNGILISDERILAVWVNCKIIRSELEPKDIQAYHEYLNGNIEELVKEYNQRGLPQDLKKALGI